MIAGAANASPEEALRALVHAGIEAHRIDPALHRVLSEQVPRESYPDESHHLAGALQSMIEELLRERAPHLTRSRLRMLAFVIESTIEAVTHRAVVEAPEFLARGQLEREALPLLHGYVAESIQ